MQFWSCLSTKRCLHSLRVRAAYRVCSATPQKVIKGSGGLKTRVENVLLAIYCKANAHAKRSHHGCLASHDKSETSL